MAMRYSSTALRASPSARRPLLIQGVVLVLLCLLHFITQLDRWLLALLGVGLLLAVEFLSSPLPPKGWPRWIRQLGWLVAVLLVTGVSFQLYFLPHATTLQRLGMGALVLYGWVWSGQRLASTGQRHLLAFVLALSWSGLVGLITQYMYWGLYGWPFFGLVVITTTLGALAVPLGGRWGHIPVELWWRWPQWLHLLLLLLGLGLEVWRDQAFFPGQLD